MKKLLCALAVASVMTASPAANGAFLSLSDGGTTVTIGDNGLGDSNPVVGAVTYVGAVGGNWLVNVTTGLTKPVVGTSLLPNMTLNSVNATSGGAGALTIRWSDDLFGPLAAAQGFNASLSGSALAPGGSVTLNTWGDTGNVIFANDGSTAQSTQTFSAVPFGGSVPAPLGGPLAAPYSLTMEAQIVHGANGSTGFNGSLDTSVAPGPTLIPEPMSLTVWSLLGCAGGLACLALRRSRTD